MSNSTTWFVGTEPVRVEGKSGSYPNTTTGGEITFDFYIHGRGSNSDGSAAYGESYGEVYGSSSTSQTAEWAYNRLKEYLRYAGYATVETTLGSAYFSEPFNFENADVDTLLVPIYPHDDIDQARGVWGVIVGGDDSTEIFGAIARVSLDVFVLAEHSEYDTEQDVRDEFEASI